MTTPRPPSDASEGSRAAVLIPRAGLTLMETTMPGRPKKGFGRTDLARAREARQLKVAVGLHCHLHNLCEDILNGDADKLAEFQEYLQYAPPSTKESIQRKLETRLP